MLRPGRAHYDRPGDPGLVFRLLGQVAGLLQGLGVWDVHLPIDLGDPAFSTSMTAEGDKAAAGANSLPWKIPGPSMEVDFGWENQLFLWAMASMAM